MRPHPDLRQGRRHVAGMFRSAGRGRPRAPRVLRVGSGAGIEPAIRKVNRMPYDLAERLAACAASPIAPAHQAQVSSCGRNR
jgi:hypothetical protein